jgi:hypothetical protein
VLFGACVDAVRGRQQRCSTGAWYALCAGTQHSAAQRLSVITEHGVFLSGITGKMYVGGVLQ